MTSFVFSTPMCDNKTPSPRRLFRKTISSSIKKYARNIIGRKSAKDEIRERQRHNENLRRHIHKIENKSRAVLRRNEKKYARTVMRRNRLDYILKESNEFIVQQHAQIQEVLLQVARDAAHIDADVNYRLALSKEQIMYKEEELNAIQELNYNLSSTIQKLMATIKNGPFESMGFYEEQSIAEKALRDLKIGLIEEKEIIKPPNNGMVVLEQKKEQSYDFDGEIPVITINSEQSI